MKIAFLISAHTDAPQLKRLINALPDESHFFVHIDRKSDITPFKQLMADDNRVHFLPDRVDVRWGTILQVEYQMQLIKAALDFPMHFDRLMTLSGLDYPLWSNSQIVDFFKKNADKEYISGFDMATEGVPDENTIIYRVPRPFFSWSFLSNKRNQQLSIICRKAAYHTGIRKSLILPNGMHLYKGASWWSISEGLAQYIYDTYQSDKTIYHYFKDSFGQDETLIQTIAFNSTRWKDRCILFKGHYPGLQALTPLTYIYYHPVIKIMTEDDYDVIMKSGKMFARKFVSGKSDKLIDLLCKQQKMT